MIGRSFLRRIRRIPALVAESRFQNGALRRFEGDIAPQLFILGLPRSGTTLVYQYIMHRFHVAYFTNGVGIHAYDPSRETHRQLRRNAPYASDFKSTFGRSDGAMAPREAGNFWLRFFDIDAYQTFEDIAPDHVETLRRTMATVQVIFDGAPFVNKNVKHMLRIDALKRIFPQAHFLVVNRNMTDVALSVLRGRKDMLGDYGSWFSVKPPDYHDLALLDPVHQVCGQLFSLQDRLDQDLQRVDPACVHQLDYAEFCADPDSLLECALAVFKGVEEKNPPVADFETRAGVPENEMETRLVALIKERLGQ